MRSELVIPGLDLQCTSIYNASLTYAVSLSSSIMGQLPSTEARTIGYRAMRNKNAQ